MNTMGVRDEAIIIEPLQLTYMLTIDCKSLANDNFVFLLKAEKLLSTVKYDLHDDKLYFPLLFMRSIHGIAHSCNVLILNSDLNHIHILLRSMIEALSKLSMLSQDTSNLDVLKRSASEDYLKFLKMDHTKHFLSSNDRLLKNSKEIFKEQLSDLKQVPKKGGVATIINMYLSNELLIAYKMFCCDEHHDLDTLHEIHTYNRNDLDLAAITVTMLQIVFQGFIFLHVISPVYTVEQIEDLENHIARTKSDYFPNTPKH